MASAVFPDNTVLCNFAAVRRLDLLEGWLRGRGRWTEAVAFEASRSENWLPDLALLRSAGWLGAPIEIAGAQEQELIERIRRVVFGGAPSQPMKHLGEAQTCFLLAERAEFSDAWWLSDDADAYDYAMRRHIHALRTIDIVRQIISDGDLTAALGFELLRAMDAAGRGLVLPRVISDLE